MSGLILKVRVFWHFSMMTNEDKEPALRGGGALSFLTGRTGHVQYEDRSMANGCGRGLLLDVRMELVRRGVASCSVGGVGNFASQDHN